MSFCCLDGTAHTKPQMTTRKDFRLHKGKHMFEYSGDNRKCKTEDIKGAMRTRESTHECVTEFLISPASPPS